MLSCSKVTFIFVNMSYADATLKQYKKKSRQMAVTMTHEEDEDMYKNRSSQLGLLEDALDFRHITVQNKIIIIVAIVLSLYFNSVSFKVM